MEARQRYHADDMRYLDKTFKSVLINASVKFELVLKNSGMDEEHARQIALAEFGRVEAILKQAKEDPEAAWEAWLKAQKR